MDAQNFKLELIKLLLETDEPSLLEKVRHILLPTKIKQQSEKIVGFKPNGDPVSQIEFEEEMKVSIGQIAKGEVMSHEDLVREAENW